MDLRPKDLLQKVRSIVLSENVLYAGTDSTVDSSLLDGAVKDEVLEPWFPLLQTAVTIDDKGVERLIQSLDARKAGVHMYKVLMGGGATHDIPGSDFNNLLKRIAVEPGGLEIALEILRMRIVFAPDRSTSTELIDIGCELVGKLTFTRNRTLEAYSLGIIAKRCLIGKPGAAAVRTICRNLKQAVSNSETCRAPR